MNSPLEPVCKLDSKTNLKHIKLQTYRFVFSEGFADELYEFAKIHQYDDRKVFKESWKLWLEDKDVVLVVKDEINRLSENGFVGDILDKMYKSARYYYRKKSTQPTIQPERKQYVGFTKEILETMDNHIRLLIANYATIEDKITISKISPAKGFDAYCNEYKHQIIVEATRIYSSELESISRDDIEEMTNRFKKTYKNRFYKIKENMRTMV